jgi:hypothetical protein
VFGSFRGSMSGFLSLVIFILAAPPFHDDACGVITSSLVLVDFFFLFSVHLDFLHVTLQNFKFVLPLNLIYILFVYIFFRKVYRTRFVFFFYPLICYVTYLIPIFFYCYLFCFRKLLELKFFFFYNFIIL